MRKILATIVIACAATFALSACDQKEKAKDATADQAAAVVPKPTDANDKTAWKKYLVSVVTANMTGVKTNHPYMYFVPSGDDDAAKTDRANQLDNVKNVVARGVLPGNLMAFGGPDSKITADLIVEAFKEVQAGAFKDVIVLFIGSAADAETVKQALTPSGAEVRFVEAK